jgi:hypothetical protein
VPRGQLSSDCYARHSGSVDASQRFSKDVFGSGLGIVTWAVQEANLAPRLYSASKRAATTAVVRHFSTQTCFKMKRRDQKPEEAPPCGKAPSVSLVPPRQRVMHQFTVPIWANIGQRPCLPKKAACCRRTATSRWDDQISPGTQFCHFLRVANSARVAIGGASLLRPGSPQTGTILKAPAAPRPGLSFAQRSSPPLPVWASRKLKGRVAGGRPKGNRI